MRTRFSVDQWTAWLVGLERSARSVNDWLGLGFMWNDPSDGNRADDYGLETFWRLQMTENIQVTPDVQVYFDPSNNPTRDIEAAFGLRVAMYF